MECELVSNITMYMQMLSYGRRNAKQGGCNNAGTLMRHVHILFAVCYIHKPGNYNKISWPLYPEKPI